ncbi:hypothetical protein E4O00_02335 [Treponema sp. OMZ 788]|uniref:hypothetical protein n=1 Tax=Treponema sp. OMZ 788 TaxID=2563664 RepID=UPI0020A2FFA5|nr:hypothetical protein [Treponema sp. OMZ 788]UTC65053.1 hypothetical protein E4O00_02335 [Treponema sp. OMZ 788]
MKKLVLTVMLLAMASALFAQFTTPSTDTTWSSNLWDSVSFEKEVTSGTFSNEIDKAFSPNADFGLYGQQFIYGGLGNPLKLNTLGSLSAGDGFNFGYYRPGTMPMSYYGTFAGTRLANRPSSSFKKDWNDNDHKDLKSTTKTTYNRVPLIGKTDSTFRFLIGIGKDKKMVTGFYFNMQSDNTGYTPTNFVKTVYTDNKTPDNSFTESITNLNTAGVTNMKNPATGSGTVIAPNVIAGQAGTMAFKNRFSIGVPLALKTGAIAHTANFDLSAYLEDNNAAYKNNKKNENIEYKYTGFKSHVALTASYGLEMPVNDREGDMWFGSALLGIDFKNNQHSYKYEHKDKQIKADASETSSPKLGFKLEAEGGRLFNFTSPKKAFTFKLSPSLKLGLDTRMTSTAYEGYNTKIKANYSNSKASGAGDVKSLSYTKADKTGFYQNTTTLSTEIKAPMGLKVLPENWKIGFLLGADLSAKYEVTITRNTTNNHKRNNVETTKVTLGDGSSLPDTNVNNTDYPGTTYTSKGTIASSAFTFHEKHYFGFTIPFEGGAHLDFFMEGGPGGSWLINVNDFRIQAFIPLGAPKERVKTAAKEVKAKK